MRQHNLAERAARWSSANRKKVIFGWIIFVIVAMAAGNVSGNRKLTEADYTTNDSARAQVILSTAGFETPATESILIQSKQHTISDPVFRATVNDVVDSVKTQPELKALLNPLMPNGQGLISKDGHSALVQVFLKGDAAKAEAKVQPFLDAVRTVQKNHPGFTVAEFGPASATKELNKTLGKDFQRAEYTTLPVTLVILLFAFGALVAAGLPVILAFGGWQ